MTWMVCQKCCFAWRIYTYASVGSIMCVPFPMVCRDTGLDGTEVSSSAGQLLVTLPVNAASPQLALYCRGRDVGHTQLLKGVTLVFSLLMHVIMLVHTAWLGRQPYSISPTIPAPCCPQPVHPPGSTSGELLFNLSLHSVGPFCKHMCLPCT